MLEYEHICGTTILVEDMWGGLEVELYAANGSPLDDCVCPGCGEVIDVAALVAGGVCD